jgi:hypothetical protein
MNVYAFPTQAAAQACQAAVDAHIGFPVAGHDVGPGAHAPAAQSRTTTYSVPFQNATTLQWGYLADATTTPILAPQAVALGLPAPVAVDATWYPPNTNTATAMQGVTA